VEAVFSDAGRVVEKKAVGRLLQQHGRPDVISLFGYQAAKQSINSHAAGTRTQRYLPNFEGTRYR